MGEEGPLLDSVEILEPWDEKFKVFSRHKPHFLQKNVVLEAERK